VQPGEGLGRLESRAPEAPGAPPHPWDGYLTGPENELAIAAAQAMARGEHQAISPLVVHGPSGVGKSRLLAGMVAERLRRYPGSTVAHLDAEAFAATCAEAAGAEEGWPALRGRFRTVALFVLEDLESLAHVPLARDELAHTLDALDTAGAAVAVSARSAPSTWPRREWPSRLISRLLGGLTVRIAPPGLASRRRYVLHSAGQQGLALKAEAVEQLAQAADGFRTLDGWVARLVLEARLGREPQGRGGAGRTGGAGHHTASRAVPDAAPLNLQAVTAILAEETRLAGPATTIDAVARAMAAQFGIRLNLLRGPSRRAAVVEARHLAMHLARTLTGSSFAAIGAYFGGRDPATVRHACKAAAERISADPALAASIATIGRRWQRGDG
jgi:chromosomal replication initiator protein